MALKGSLSEIGALTTQLMSQMSADCALSLKWTTFFNRPIQNVNNTIVSAITPRPIANKLNWVKNLVLFCLEPATSFVEDEDFKSSSHEGFLAANCPFELEHHARGAYQVQEKGWELVEG